MRVLNSLIVFCLTSQVVMAAEDVSYPSDWGQVSSDNMKDVTCPSLDGKYFELGWSYLLKDGIEIPPNSEPITSRRLIGGVDKFKKVDLEPSKFNDNFILKQENTEQFTLVRQNKNYWEPQADLSAPVIAETISKASDGLICKNGWWELPVDDFKTDNEGSALSRSSKIRFTRLNNNDLIIYDKSVDKRTDFFIITQTTVWDTYLRFKFKSNN